MDIGAKLKVTSMKSPVITASEVTREISGLPLTCKPEWVGVSPDQESQMHLSLLENRIIVSQPAGFVNLEGMQQFLSTLDQIVKGEIPKDKPYVLIEDFANLRGSSMDARKLFIRSVRRRTHLIGIVFCNVSQILKLSVKLGKRLYKGDKSIQLADNYSHAIGIALKILALEGFKAAEGKHDSQPEAPPSSTTQRSHAIIRNENWALTLDGFSTCLEIMDNHILHSISAGSLKEEHIEPISKLRERVQQSLLPNGHIEYIVAEISDLKGTNYRSRRRYIDSLRQWDARHPLQMFIYVGANRLMRAAAHLAGPFLPFKIRVVNHLEEALAMVARDQYERKTTASAKIKDIRPQPDIPVNPYVNELLKFLGSIDWEHDGMGQNTQPDETHPFSPVFGAINLIKSELDELARDRNKAEEALREMNDKLELEVQKRTLELTKANRELTFEIEEHKKSQVALQKAKQDAERANQAKSDFLANMSHELRTPLNHIIGFTEMLLGPMGDNLNSQQDQYLTYVFESSDHLLSLINDILDLSKVEAGKTDLSVSQLDLQTLLAGSAAMVKVKAQKHSIHISLSHDNAPQTITADERMLKQILYNLLSNAIKFTPPRGTIDLTARIVTCVKTRDAAGASTLMPVEPSRNDVQDPVHHEIEGLKIEIRDTGIGLRPEEIETIFEPFEQVDGTSSRKFEGTGLGLSLTRSLVRLHGGRIWAESEGKNKGSCFHVLLPLGLDITVVKPSEIMEALAV